jgi:hypothetical protein
MGRFSHIKKLQCKIKNEMIERILGNQDLLKYIYYPSSNPLNEIDIEDTISLINTFVFKRSKALNVNSDAQNYVFVKINSPSNNRGGALFKDVNIDFLIICHNNLIDNLDTGEDRGLCILDEIDFLLDDSRSEFWIGKIQYQNFREILVNDSFSGYVLSYKVTI